MTGPQTFLRRAAILPIRLYQWTLSPMLRAAAASRPAARNMRRMPVLEHGIWRGAALAVRRLLRCHPWAVMAMTGAGLRPPPRGALRRQGRG